MLGTWREFNFHFPCRIVSFPKGTPILISYYENYGTCMSNRSHLHPLDLNSPFKCKYVGCILFMTGGNKNHHMTMGEKRQFGQSQVVFLRYVGWSARGIWRYRISAICAFFNLLVQDNVEVTVCVYSILRWSFQGRVHVLVCFLSREPDSSWQIIKQKRA